MLFLLFAFIARLCRGFAINSRNSRLRGINSRLGLHIFPVRVATGIWSQVFEFVSFLCGEMAVWRREPKNFPAQRKSRECGSTEPRLRPRSTWPAGGGRRLLRSIA